MAGFLPVFIGTSFTTTLNDFDFALIIIRTNSFACLRQSVCFIVYIGSRGIVTPYL